MGCKEKLFDEKSNELIRSYMKEFGHRHDRFVMISKKLPSYTPKQITNHWRNYLDPRLCRKPLGIDEKKYIIKWVQNNRTEGVIHWKILLRSLKETFNKFHSENEVKNFWYSEMRKRGKQRKQKGNSLDQNRITVSSDQISKPFSNIQSIQRQGFLKLPTVEPHFTPEFNAYFSFCFTI